MVDGVAAKARRRTLQSVSFNVILGVSLALGLAPATAQTQSTIIQETAAQEAAPAVSRCEPASETLASPAPLPHVTAALARDDKKLRLLIIGGAGADGRSSRRTYPATLEALLEKSLTGIDVIIVNRPLSGETVGGAQERIRTETALQHPDLLIWQVGGNDALAHVDPGEYESILSQGVRWAQEAGIDVLLVGFETNPWLHDDAEVTAIQEATRKVAATENVFYLRRAEAVQVAARAQARADLGDNPLPVEAGGQCLAEQVAQSLAANLMLRRTRPAPAATP